MEKKPSDLKRALILALEDQFYPAQKAVATQLASAVERAGLLKHEVLRDITRPVFVPALTAEFTEQGAEELTQILRCAYREMPKGQPAAKPKKVASDAQVLVTMGQQGNSKVQGKTTNHGSQSQGPMLQLDLELGGTQPKPKPRTGGIVDKGVWVSCLDKATIEVTTEFEISNGIGQYYASMCKVGKLLLVSTIVTKAQSLYDYRIGRLLYRRNRKQKAS